MMFTYFDKRAKHSENMNQEVELNCDEASANDEIDDIHKIECDDDRRDNSTSQGSYCTQKVDYLTVPSPTIA
jgi:hypothetical protein